MGVMARNTDEGVPLESESPDSDQREFEILVTALADAPTGALRWLVENSKTEAVADAALEVALDRLTATEETSGPARSPDSYVVCRRAPSGGWEGLEEFDGLEEPISADEFRAAASDELPGGTYRIFGKDAHRRFVEMDPDAKWTVEVPVEAV